MIERVGRIIFVYIARFFPRLKELSIGTPVVCYSGLRNGYCPRLRVELGSGLFLLGRLNDLRGLKFNPNPDSLISSCEEADLNWIIPAPSGRRQESNVWKRKQVEQQQQIMEERLETLDRRNRGLVEDT